MYRHVDAMLVRAATLRLDQGGPWPDLTSPAAGPVTWRAWLERTLRDVPGFADAVEVASPRLAARVLEIREGRALPDPVIRRAVLALMRYRLRATGRATPFGLFAGVTPARVGAEGAVRVGGGHRAVARVRAEWLAGVVERLEADPALRALVSVIANNLVVERDGRLILEHRPAGPNASAPVHVSVAATEPVRAAMGIARAPIRWAEMADKLAAQAPRVPRQVIDDLIARLVAQRLLLSSLRPPMSAPDPLGYLLDQVSKATADQLSDADPTVAGLREIRTRIVRHNTEPVLARTRWQRADVVAAMGTVQPTDAGALGVDLRLDWDVTVPHTVAAEAARAAGVLIRLAPHTARSGWSAWHGRFLERYGSRALVPVREVVDGGIGLGYPAGFLGEPPLPPAALSERDVKLLTLAQSAALRRQREILLDEAMLTDLTVIPADAPIQPATELTVRVHATSPRNLDDGRFTLAVVGVSRTAGTTTGRFLHLLDPADRDRFAAAYAHLPTATAGALPAQISAPGLYAATGDVSHAPQVIGHPLPVGDYHDDPHGTSGRSIALEDLAVTADARRLWLVCLSRRLPVEPVLLNAVEPVARIHPLVRFLAEISTALSVPCAALDWGAAAGLPYLPALRYGRTVLSPARWLLHVTDLPGRDVDQPTWNHALATWGEQVALPRRVYAGEDDQRLGLDLDEPAHRVLLRTHLERAGTAVLRAAPDPDGTGWSGGHVQELVIPLAATAAPADPPWWLKRAETVDREHEWFPGQPGRLYLKIYARAEQQTAILTGHLPRLLDELGDDQNEDQNDAMAWWFLRYHDLGPGGEPHLRLRLTFHGDDLATALDRIAAWSRGLRRAGLSARLAFDTDMPETARFGGRSALDAVERVFAADSVAALAQLTAARATGGPDIRAVTAASLVDITTALIGDATGAMAWLIAHTRADTAAPPRVLYRQAIALADPHDHSGLAATPGGGHILDRWARRRAALVDYRDLLHRTGTADPLSLLPDLLHLHHARINGVDPAGERAVLHLARAAALSWTTRTAKKGEGT